MVLRTWLATGACLFLFSACSQAQPAAGGPLTHDELVGALHALASRTLPAGDTLISWAPDPVLFHTAARAGDTVRAGLLRGDRMQGEATVHWSAGRPTAFTVEWSRPDTQLVRLQGNLSGTAIRLTGTHDATVALPESAWAVADYGMESRLLEPLYTRLPPDTTTQVAVLRPYGFKWDTLQVRVRHSAGCLHVRQQYGGAEPEELVFASGRLIRFRQPKSRSETRPLAGSPASELQCTDTGTGTRP